MTGLFQAIIQMSITSSVVILFVCLARLFLKKAPKIYSYALWALVLFRLLCPASITSSLSLIPKEVAQVESSVQKALSQIDLSQKDLLQSSLPQSNVAPNDLLQNSLSQSNSSQNNTTVTPPIQSDFTSNPGELPSGYGTVTDTSSKEPKDNPGSLVWLFGVLAMFCYSIFSLLRIYRQVQVCLPKDHDIFIAEDIDTPFTLGFLSPKIYLPTGLSEKEQGYIVAHELHHIKRLDHLIRFAAFLALSLHWFNPLVWLAFLLAGKDMEMSCDEAVMKQFSEDIRQEYSASLLNLSTGRKHISMAPLSFGEGNVKGRIKNVMAYQRPVFWMTLVAAVLCAALAFCLLTDPNDAGNESSETETSYTEEELKEMASSLLIPDFYLKHVYDTYADLDFDGRNECIRLWMQTPNADTRVRELEDMRTLFHDGYGAKVEIYKGIDKDTYAEEPFWTFDDISTSRPGNYQISCIRKDRRSYLLISSLQEHQSLGAYTYKVLGFDTEGKEVVMDEYSVAFRSDESTVPIPEANLPIRSEAVLDFQQHLAQWYDSGSPYGLSGDLIIAADLNLQDNQANEVLFSRSMQSFDPNDYYDKIFKTNYVSQYFTFAFPKEWAGKLFYEESDDGKKVNVYHHRTYELDHEKGLLGTISLVTEDTALEYLRSGTGRYVGNTITLEDGVAYFPMSRSSEGVQYMPETEAEFATLQACFGSTAITSYVWVTQEDTYQNPLKGNPLASYPLGNIPIANLGQPLIWDYETGETICFGYNYEMDFPTLLIGDTNYSRQLLQLSRFYVHADKNPWYTVVDLDTHDDYREILIYDNGPSADPGFNILSIKNNTLLHLGSLGTRSLEPLKGDGTLTYYENVWVPENNSVRVTVKVQDGHLVYLPQEEYLLTALDYHDITQELTVYKERDLSSETVTLKPDQDQICFTKLFTLDTSEPNFIEIKTAYGEIYYLYYEDYLYHYVADLYIAG